jgi:AcrR family transcriptional regulator
VARTTTITTEQILEAARAVFLEQGVNATTVDVANRAGISSASIFKRYPTKDALFLAAMTEAPPRRIWTPELETMIGHGDPRADLTLIARRIAEYVSLVLPRQMLMRSMGKPGELPTPPRVTEDFVAMTAYFGREMALGRIARGDPTIPVQALFHAVAGFGLSQAVQPSDVLTNTTRFLEDFVGLMWNGLEPKPE